MTHQEILTRAIQLAIDGGWKQFDGGEVLHYRNSNDKYVKLQMNHDGMVASEHYEIASVIFNHDFAKSLWGEEETETKFLYKEQRIPDWLYHLQSMVIAPDPIKYLGDNLRSE